MGKKGLYILVVVSTLNGDIVSFYKKSIETLEYNKRYKLEKRSNDILKKSIEESRFANFSIDTKASLIKAENISNPFNSVDIGLSDKLDLFNKSRHQITLISLDTQSKKALLLMEKEKLFIYLSEIIKIYSSIKELLTLHNSFLEEQENIFNRLKILESLGDISRLIVIRFKNSLLKLQSKIVKEKNTLLEIESQLNLYVPNEPIPTLENVELIAKKEDFIANSPKYKLNQISSEKLLVKSNQLKDKYLPNIVAGVNYQQNSDPTGFGDSYELNLKLNIPISKGDERELEALRVKSLSLSSKDIEYKILRERDYIKHYQSYISAEKELIVLNQRADEVKVELDMVKRAFLKKYVDFNTYIESLREFLLVKEEIIKLKYQKGFEATILNTLSKGTIYE